MTNDNNIDKTRSLEQLLSELKDDIHLSFDSIVAYAKDELSQESKAKIASHIMDCQKCRQALDIAKKSIEAEEELDSLDQSASTAPMSEDLKAKAILVARINLKRDEIAEKIARKLLPEISWSMIPITIKNMRDTSRETKYRSSKASVEMAMAAFSAGTTASESEAYEVIGQALRFTDIVSGLLIKRCRCIDEIEEKIPQCVDEASEIMGDIKVDDNTKELILKIIRESLTGDEKG